MKACFFSEVSRCLLVCLLLIATVDSTIAEPVDGTARRTNPLLSASKTTDNRSEPSASFSRPSIDLAGDWIVQLDPEDAGERKKWFGGPLGKQTITLPGTTDQASLGYQLDRKTMAYPVDYPLTAMAGKEETRVDRKGHLLREHMYLGKAWYQRSVTIPEALAGKHFQLHLERVLWQSSVWLDNNPVGKNDSLSTEHRHDLGLLDAGTYQITVSVDNRKIHNLEVYGHAYGPETQSRWNGLVGDLKLVASDAVSVDQVQVYPAADRKSVRLRANLVNATGQLATGQITAAIVPAAGGDPIGTQATDVRIDAVSGQVEWTVPVSEDVRPWDEFDPTRYAVELTLSAQVGDRSYRDTQRELFGFRQIQRDGRHILVNGRKVFLRGILDCCVFPKTGHPPTSVSEWKRIMGIIKSYGFNHVRFHSWCPPEAAFEAADQLGLYLQPEAPYWDHHFGQDQDVAEFVRQEILRISEAYGNHPSFALFCVGNEFNGNVDWDLLNTYIAEAKRRDPRRLYNGSTARKLGDADDFWTTHSTGKAGTRGIGANRTDWDFTDAAQTTSVPIIAHETGQRPVFPDYADLLPKFTGPLKPYNYQRLREKAVQNGLIDRVKDFERASAWFQVVQYKAEHEAMLRTPDFAGYQLLQLNDFTGQGEALVGILDPFWESKGVVGAGDVLPWNSPTVPLARFEKYEWSTSEPLVVEIEVAHYGPANLRGVAAEWSLTARDGRKVAEGTLAPKDVSTGTVTQLGRIKASLDSLKQAAALVLTVRLGDTQNSWNLWAYPPQQQQSEPEDVLIATQFDEQVEQALSEGRRVLLLKGDRNRHNGSPGFFSQYWSGGWWGDNFSHLGLVCDPDHGALAAFPTEGHSDWQWFNLASGATTWDLTELAPDHQPIVQLVSDFHYCRRLAQVFETKNGRGKLLVCGYDLTSDLDNRHAARQLRRSLLDYVQSDAFRPEPSMTVDTVRELFQLPFMQRIGAKVVAFDSQAEGHEAAKAIDGRPETFWHTPWTGSPPPFPHHLDVTLKKPARIAGLRILNRQDGNAGGHVKKYRIYLSNDGRKWGEPVAEGELTNDMHFQTIPFDVTTARYIRFETLSNHEKNAWASLAELEIIPGSKQE